jgi:hypothetical protein
MWNLITVSGCLPFPILADPVVGIYEKNKDGMAVLVSRDNILFL